MTKAIAENIFKDLRAYGLADKDIVAISSEILNRLTDDLKSRNGIKKESDFRYQTPILGGQKKSVFQRSRINFWVILLF